MTHKLVNIGFGNSVVSKRVIAIISPNTAPVKRLRDEAREEKRLIDAIHELGALVTFHNCGDAAKIMHLYNEMDIDCWGYLTPPPFGDVDLAEALRNESIEGYRPLREEARQGAGRFQDGLGRRGNFENI